MSHHKAVSKNESHFDDGYLVAELDTIELVCVLEKFGSERRCNKLCIVWQLMNHICRQHNRRRLWNCNVTTTHNGPDRDSLHIHHALGHMLKVLPSTHVYNIKLSHTLLCVMEKTGLNSEITVNTLILLLLSAFLYEPSVVEFELSLVPKCEPVWIIRKGFTGCMSVCPFCQPTMTNHSTVTTTITISFCLTLRVPTAGYPVCWLVS